MAWRNLLSTEQLTGTMSELKKRLRTTVLKYLAVLCIALAYLVFVLCTGVGIPCPFYKITGFECVGCGVSRMLISLIRLDIRSAFEYNSFLLITGPFIIAYLTCSEIRYIIYGDRRMGRWEILMWAELALAVAFGILRNIF